MGVLRKRSIAVRQGFSRYLALSLVLHLAGVAGLFALDSALRAGRDVRASSTLSFEAPAEPEPLDEGTEAAREAWPSREVPSPEPALELSELSAPAPAPPELLPNPSALPPELEELLAARLDSLEPSTDPRATAVEPPAEAPSTPAEAAEEEPAQPVLLVGAPPPYPRLSRRLGEEGAVELLLSLGADGRVLAARVVVSSGYPRLDEAAREAVLAWRFEWPEDTRARAMEVEHTVRFQLEGR